MIMARASTVNDRYEQNRLAVQPVSDVVFSEAVRDAIFLAQG
jgi:hypothetical protein